MTQISVDLCSGFTIELNVDNPITTYQLEDFVKDYYGVSGEILLLYQPNPYGSRHYRYGQRPELVIGGADTSTEITINGMPRILKGGSKVRTAVGKTESRALLGKRKRDLEPLSLFGSKKVGHGGVSTYIGRSASKDSAMQATSTRGALSAPPVTTLFAREISAAGGDQGRITGSLDLSGQGPQDSMSANNTTERASLSSKAMKGLHLTVGWTGMD